MSNEPDRQQLRQGTAAMSFFGNKEQPTTPATPPSATRPDPETITRLKELEKKIALGLSAYHQAGLALTEIRDRKLYAFKWSTFESYLESRWRISREHGHRLMQAAEVCANLKGMEPLPANEAQARVLAPLEPQQQREVWKAATETLPIGNVTAEALEEVAAKVVPIRKKSRRKNPKNITVKGKGWTVTLTRRSAEIDPLDCLQEALADLQTKLSQVEVKAA